MKILAQTTPVSPITIDGAVLLILVALAMAAPEIFKGIGKLISAISDRLTVGTNAQVKGLDVFKILEEEVRNLRLERDQDQQRIDKAEEVARESKLRADKFERDFESEKEKRYRMQFDIDHLKEQLDREYKDSQAKDIVIENQKIVIINLEHENTDLKNRLLLENTHES